VKGKVSALRYEKGEKVESKNVNQNSKGWESARAGNKATSSVVQQRSCLGRTKCEEKR
jgi:hypothetical protein